MMIGAECADPVPLTQQLLGKSKQLSSGPVAKHVLDSKVRDPSRSRGSERCFVNGHCAKG